MTSNLKVLLERVEMWSSDHGLLRRDLPPSLGADTAAVYLENLNVLRALADRYGFRTHVYFQPLVFTKKHLSSYEEGIEVDDVYRRLFESSSDWIRMMDANAIVENLGSVLDVDETVFIDAFHISEMGNAIIAERIARDIGKD